MIRVAAGVLRRPHGAVLINQRPPGKIAAGRWEFPGGKIEHGESAAQALQRELREELAVVPTRMRPLIRIRHAYTERSVELDTWLIEAWDGEPHPLEGQALAWVDPARIWDYDLLEADGPIVNALRLPEQLPFTGDFASPRDLRERCLALARQGHRLLRLRVQALDDAGYQELAAELAQALASTGAQLLVDRPGPAVQLPGVAGLHLPAGALSQQAQRPVGANRWLFASCHDERDVARAAALQADAIVLGSVCSTPTHPQQAPLGWAEFSRLAALANRPAYAIGGLGPKDLPAVFGHGGQGVAGISAYWRED